MKERPILFTGPMVRATLEGRKAATRRALRKQPVLNGKFWELGGAGWSCGVEQVTPVAGHSLSAMCPYGQPGDRLWVRESTEAFVSPCGTVILSRYCADKAPVLLSGCKDPAFDGSVAHWIYPRETRPSIHMPRRASRVLLEITAVRAERLQAGDGEAAFESRYLSEGINRIHHGDGEYYYSAFRDEPHPKNWCDPFDAWRELWVSINGVESWDANPWVWVVEFERLEAAND